MIYGLGGGKKRAGDLISGNLKPSVLNTRIRVTLDI